MKNLNVVFIFVLSLFFIQSCQKDSISDPVVDPFADKAAPELPSEETFIIPFNNFSSYQEGDTDIRNPQNWIHSAANVFVWNTILAVNLAIPTAAFFESFKQRPVYQGEGVWLWAYEVSANGVTYQAELFGKLTLSSPEVSWEMYINQVGGFGRVKWYSGVTANDQSYANWTLYHNPQHPAPFVEIDYQKDNGNGVSAIRFTNIIPRHTGNGGYIEYFEGLGATGDFDRIYNVYKAETDNLLEIQWNEANKNGRVKDLEKFGDQEWHCWGTNRLNTEC